MKQLIFLALIMLTACNIEPIDKTAGVITIDSYGHLSKEDRQAIMIAGVDSPTTLFEKGQPDPAIKNKKKVIFTETIDGTYEEKLASMEITSSHAKPVSLNWDLGDEMRIVRVVLLDANGLWRFQTSTSGWRGFWVADSLMKGEPYTMMFHWDQSVKVDFVLTGKL